LKAAAKSKVDAVKLFTSVAVNQSFVSSNCNQETSVAVNFVDAQSLFAVSSSDLSSSFVAQDALAIDCTCFCTFSKFWNTLTVQVTALISQKIAPVAIVTGFTRFDSIDLPTQSNLVFSLDVASSHVLRKFCNFLFASVRFDCAVFVFIISSLFFTRSFHTSFIFCLTACSFIVASATFVSSFIFLF